MATGQAASGIYFLLRRLHSLSGVVPIGVFMIVHLTTNSSIIWGGLNSRAQTPDGARNFGEVATATFQHEVTFINELPLLLLIEVFGLWLPIAFHSILGVYYATTGKRNTDRYEYQDNWRYTLQRWTGYIGLLFIVYHVATLRWGWTPLIPGDAKWSHYFATSTLAAAIKGSASGWTFGGVIVALLYMLGVTSLVFHFANGLWTAAITWGITISEKAQQRFKYVCAGLGVGLMGAGWSALFGFLFLVDYNDAHEVERAIIVEKFGEEEYLKLLKRYENYTPEDLQERIRETAMEAWPGQEPPSKAFAKADAEAAAAGEASE